MQKGPDYLQESNKGHHFLTRFLGVGAIEFVILYLTCLWVTLNVGYCPNWPKLSFMQLKGYMQVPFLLMTFFLKYGKYSALHVQLSAVIWKSEICQWSLGHVLIVSASVFPYFKRALGLQLNGQCLLDRHSEAVPCGY